MKLLSKIKITKKKIVKLSIVLILLVAVVIFGSKYAMAKISSIFNKNTKEEVIQTAKIENKNIKTVLSSSGTIQPLNEYQVTSLTQGEVVAADFAEGDKVKKGQILYQISTDNMDSEIKQASKQVERAEETYSETTEQLEDLTLTSKASGIIRKVNVETGDNIQAGTQIAEVYDNSTMMLEVPFDTSTVSSSWVGKKASVELQDSFEILNGKVEKIAATTQVLSGNRVVKMVTISVSNPGGIGTDTIALASVSGVDCSAEGTFTPKEETVITAKTSGKISSLKIKEGQKISAGSTVLILDRSSVDKQLKSNKQAIEDAKETLQEKKDSLSDYQIASPISGTVIKKNTKEGDTISGGNNNTTALAVIYDLSAVTFDMYIDELDIKSVKTGQKVNVSADALEGVEISGIITNISLESTTSGGVTQYPVTVLIDEIGELLPGMNVTGEIITEEVTGVMAVPVDALMRGNTVYVKDTSVTEANEKVPAGFKEVEVETGLNDGDYVEIKSGLTGTEEVYIPTRTASENTMQTMMPGMTGNMGERPSDMPSGGNRGNYGGNSSGKGSWGN